MANIFDDLENQDGLVVDEKELLRRRLEAQQNPFLASEQASSSMPASPLQERFDAGIVERMKIPTLKGQDVSIDEQTGLITSIPSPVEPEKIKTEASVVSDDDLNFIDKGSKKDLAGTLDDLTKKFGKHGITFKVNADGGYETRLSDRYERIEVIAANQTKKNILYDAFTKSIVKSDANELKSFIKSNAIKTNYVPRNREEAEAIQAYSKQGLDYGLVKKSDNDMKALETSLKEANAINDLIESNARKAATSTGKVALAYKAKAKELESQFKNEYGVTPQAYIDSNSQKLKSLRDTKISNLDKSIKADREIQGRVKVLDEKAKGLLGESNKLIESAKELSINGLGVPLFNEDGSFNEEGLKKIVPNETNQGVINQIRHNLTLSDNYRKAAHSGKLQAMNYLSAQQNKNLQDQYVSNWEGFLNNATNAYRSAESTMLSLATSAAKWAGKEELAKLWNDRMLEQMYKPPLDVSSDQELINLIRQYGDPDDYLKSLGPDPLRAFNAAANMTVSSMLLFLPQMVAASGTGAGISGTLAALGTLAATRNPALARQAFVAGASTGSRVGAQYVAPTSLEYSTSLIDAIRKKYPTIEEAREKDWWNDKEIMDEALRIGVSRGIPITGAGAMFDLLSKKFAPLATASKARRVGQTLAVGAAISPVIEGAGEAAAQYASVGELDWKDIIDESVGSLGSSTVIPTLPYEVYSQLNKDYYINLADKMAKSPSFLGSMEESMEQIRDWTGRMKATRQITDDVERQIMGNMSAILEARKLLTSPDASNSERTYNRLFGTKSATEERLSKLLLAQKKMEETPKINRELQRRIQEEIDYTVTNGKPIDKQQAVNLTPIIGSEGAMYKIGDTLVTRDDVKEALVDKEKAKEMGLKEDFSNLSIENDQVLKNVVKQVSPKKVLFQQPGVSDTPSSGKTIVFHGGTLDGEGNIYVSPSREQAAEYAKMSKTSVMEFEVDPESMAQEDEVRDAFEELGLQLPEGYNLDELFLYEALDPRLDSSLKKEDIKKLYDYLKQKGYEGISFIDEDILGKDKKGVSNYIVFAKESLKPIKRDTPKASEAANVLGTIAKSKDIFNKIGEIVANWVDGDIEIDEQTGNIKITQSLDGKKIVGVPASKLIDFLFSDAPFDTRKFPVDKEWIDTVVKLRDSIIEENRVQKKKTKEKRVTKKGGIISGDEIAASAVKMGTDGDFSEFTLKRIAKEDYTEEEVSIDGLLMGDPSLKEYVDAGQLRAQPEATVGIPPIVSSNGDVIDGYNRILQAVMDGKDSIKVLKGIPKEASIPKRKPPMQRLMEAGVKAGISAKNITDLYNVNRDVFGLNISQSIANSIVMDRMMGAMAKRKGVSKDEIYKSIKFQNVTEEFIKTLSEESKPLFQMVGKNAKLSAQVFTQLEEAKKMRAENTVQKLRAPNDPPKYSELDIKWKTGWEFNPVDNKWRYEIDYGKAKDISLDNELWSKYDPSTKKGIEKGFAMAGLEFDYLHGVLSDFLDNQELFDAYPDIKNIKFKIRLSYSDSFNNVPITPQLVNQWAKSEFEGHVTSGKSIKDIIAAGGEIQLNTPPLPSKWSEFDRIDFLQKFFSRQDTRNEVLALINHEVQHLIQQEEGFIEGSYVQDKYRGSKGLDLLMRRGPKQKVFDNNQKTFIKGKIVGDALEVLDSWYKKFPNSTNEQSLGFLFKTTKDSIKNLEEDLRELKQNEPNRKDAISETADKIERLKITEKLLLDIYADVKPDEDLIAYLEKLRGRYFGTLYKRNVIPYQVYYRVAGEAEARTAADRGRMPANMRQLTLIANTVAGVSLAERLAFAYPGTLKFQGPQGAVAIGQDASAVIYAISNPNVTTPLHELAHVFESYLTEKERQAVMNSAGTPNEWNVTTSEYFARGFERYLAEGVAPSTILKSLFEAFKSWLIEIYNGITGSDIDVELNEAMRGIYGSMLGFERPKPTIASYFSGSGTMEGAFGGDVRSGLAVEFSPDYINAYNKAFGKDYEPRDVNEVSPQEIKDLDPLLFHASPVCKNYSLAKDPSQRGTTDLDIRSAKSVAAAISTAKPPIVTIENVGGYKGDLPYNIIIEALEKAGYKYDANIYDVADYGAVQTRKRVLIRAIREGELPPLPDKIGPKDWYSAIEDLIPNAPDHVIGDQAKRNIDKAMGRKPEAQQQAQPQLSDYDYFWQSKLGKDIQKKINIGRIRGLRGFKVNRNQIKLYKSSLPIIVMGEGQYGPMAANSGGPSPTLVSSSAQTAFIVLPETKQLKVLTPRMMARIMDLPDTYTVPSDYKTAKEVLGNGMSGVLTRQFIMPLIFGNSVTLAKNPTLLFQQPGAKQNTFENDGTMLNVDANAPVIAGSNLPPAVKKATKETNSEYYAEYRASDLIKTTHAPGSALVGLIRSLSSGRFSNPKITINLPFENKNVTNKIDQLRSEYQKLSDKVADKKRKQEITEELNKITKNYMGEVIKNMTLNILALYDTLTPAFIQRARNWYVGANRIANTMASKYGLSLEQTAGILAVFSPKTDWQINVSHAERLIDIIQNYSDLKVDKNYIGKVRKKIEGTRKGGVLNDKDEEFLELLSNATSNYPNGMSINEMSDIGFDESTQGLLVRAIMTEKFPKTYAETYPEGDLFRKAKKAYAESSYDFMGKAIRIYRNNSLGVIHEEIGDANKVRNFYNNIVDPFSPVPYVTGDTHAIAAAMGMPLAADDAGLLKLFDGGISPMYTMLKEAYIAATEVINQNDGTDFLPREMQSIIWEAIRMGMNELSKNLRQELNEELVKNKKENSYEKTRRVLAEFRQEGIRTKNPEWGGSGFSVQVSEILRASKEETVKRVSQVVAVWRQLRGGRGGNLTTALGREFRVKLNNFYASFLASRGDVSRSLELARFLNKAFPGVSVFVDKTSFQEVMKEPGTKKFLNKNRKEIYGVTLNGRIYINPDLFKDDVELMETMIHEFGHIWVNYIKVNNRELYDQGVKLAKEEHPELYQTELLKNKNDKERAIDETLATLIGKKGQSEGKAMRRGIAIALGTDPDKVDDTTVAGFSNWLNKMWEYVRKEFRSLRGLSVEEIQNITLTEFIDGALFDLFSGEPVPQSQLAFENSLVQEPQFNSSTSMYDLINQARNDGYRDAEIRRVLEVNGFAAEDINEALKVYLDVLTVMPGSFAQVPGGAFAGQRMYESLMADVQAYAKTGVKSAQVREYAQNKLKDQQLFKDSTEFQRMAMMVDLDKSINISANKAITAEMRKIRAAIAGIKKGKSQMSTIQRSLIAFIKKSLPVSTYEKRDVVDLMKKIQALDLNNIDQIKREVFDYVTKFRIKNEKERLQTLLSTKLAKLESSRLKGLMSVEFQERFSELKSNLMGESDALTNPSKVEDKIAELNVEFLDVQNQVFAQGMNELWGKMEDLQFAIQYNSTLLLDDDNPNKLLSLEELVEKVDALISAERSSFKDFLKSESERYNEMKNYLLYDISSGKYDVNFNNKEEVEDAITQIENDQLDEKKRNWFMAAINRIVSILDLSVLNTEDLDSVIDRISKATGQLFGGITQELIGQRIDDSRDNFIALRAMAKEMISQNAERIFGKNYRDVMERNSKKSVLVEINRDTGPAKRPVKRIELSQNEMYYLYNLYKDPANHPGFKTLMGDSYPEVMNEIFNKLDPQVIEWANWQVDEFYPAMYPIYNEVYKSIYRTNMPWNAHYAGRVFREGMPDFSTIDFLRDPKGFKMFAGGQSTKARVKNSAAIRPMDGDYVLRSYVKDMNFFAAFGEAFRDLSKLLNNPLIRKAMDAFVGEDVRKYLGLQQGEEKGGVLDAILSANLNRSNEPAILESITKGYVFAKLGVNFRVFLYQTASFLNFTMFIGYRNYALFAAKAFGNLATGGKSNAYRLFKQMYENSQYLRDREDTESILDLMAGFNAKNAKGETKSLLDRVTEGSVGATLMFMLRNGDKAGIAGSIPNYLYYKTEYANMYGVDLDSQEAIDYAIKKVNKQVRKVAQDNESENKSLLQSTGGALAKGFYLFASQPLQLLRKEIRSVRNIYRILAGLEGAKGTLQENARVFITAHFVSPLVFQWLALGLPGVARKWNDDDEDELILAAIIGNLNQIFVLGQLLDTAKDAILKKPWAKVPETAVPYKIVTQLAVLMVDAINTTDADKRLDAQIKFAIAIAELSGIPASTMLGLFKNYEKLLKGEVSGFGEAFLRMFNFPERQITGPKKDKNPYAPSGGSSRSRKSENPYAP